MRHVLQHEWGSYIQMINELGLYIQMGLECHRYVLSRNRRPNMY